MDWRDTPWQCDARQVVNTIDSAVRIRLATVQYDLQNQRCRDEVKRLHAAGNTFQVLADRAKDNDFSCSHSTASRYAHDRRTPRRNPALVIAMGGKQEQLRVSKLDVYETKLHIVLHEALKVRFGTHAAPKLGHLSRNEIAFVELVLDQTRSAVHHIRDEWETWLKAATVSNEQLVDQVLPESERVGAFFAALAGDLWYAKSCKLIEYDPEC